MNKLSAVFDSLLYLFDKRRQFRHREIFLRRSPHPCDTIILIAPLYPPLVPIVDPLTEGRVAPEGTHTDVEGK